MRGRWQPGSHAHAGQVGYYESYARSHEALDADQNVMDEVRNVAMALIETVRLLRDGGMPQPDRSLTWPRPK